MCNYREGNFLWDKNNQVLVCSKLGTNNGINEDVRTAFPIRLTYNLLNKLWGPINGNKLFINGILVETFNDNVQIIIGVQAVRIQYLHELQDYFADNGNVLNIDVNILKQYCESNI